MGGMLRAKNTMKNTSINLATKLPGANQGSKVKKLTLEIDTRTSDLTHEVKRVFDMAKSSGQELDLTFCQKQAVAV
jgi:hypothetical protein